LFVAKWTGVRVHSVEKRLNFNNAILATNVIHQLTTYSLKLTAVARHGLLCGPYPYVT